MKRSELFDKIRASVKSSPIWPYIEADNTRQKCALFSAFLYEDLQTGSQKVEGLSLAVVRNVLPYQDHAWLIAHHKDAGYFMIDPTMGQFARTPDDKGYNDVFIGSYDEMEAFVKKGKYKLPGSMSFEELWSPAVTLMHTISPKKEMRYYDPKDKELWDKHEFKIAPHGSWDNEDVLGFWAARMEEAGADWKKILGKAYGNPKWPEHPNEKALYDDISLARNRYIELGNDKQGVPFKDRIRSYSDLKPVTQR